MQKTIEHNTKNIKISVIVPIFNSNKFINKCVISILKQTIREIEIILIEDHSTDNSLDVIKNLSYLDNRIKIIANDVHKGAGESRNIGINISHGEYLSFLDSDDIFQETYLEELYNYVKLKNADIVFSKFNIIDENDNIVSKNNGFGKVVCNNIDYSLYKNKINIFSITTPAPWNKLYNRKFIIDNKLKFQNTKIANDLSFFKKSFFLAKSIYSLDASLINYREKWGGNTYNTRYLYYNDVLKANYDVKFSSL